MGTIRSIFTISLLTFYKTETVSKLNGFFTVMFYVKSKHETLCIYTIYGAYTEKFVYER